MRIVLYIIILTSLFSCQSRNHKANIRQDWSEVKTWGISGKMAINDGNNSGSGKFNWETSNDYLKARFKALTGGNWQIEENINGAFLSSSKHPDKFAKHAETLILNELGWSFPLNNLKFWLRAFNSHNQLSIHNKQIEVLKDSGWVITYQKWKQTEMGLLPTKIKASKPPYSVKLIIYKWVFE